MRFPILTSFWKNVIDDFEIGKEFVGRLFHQGDFVGYT
jgi:hypothetical protein